MEQTSTIKVLGIIAISILILSAGILLISNKNQKDANSGDSISTQRSQDTMDTHESVKYFRNENDWMGAYIAVQQEVRKKLDLPNSVEFPWNTGVHVERLGKDQMYEVDSYVEIESASNKMERIPFFAKVHQDEDDRWVIFELSIRD